MTNPWSLPQSYSLHWRFCQYKISATTSVHIQAASQLVKSSSPKVIDIASGAGEPGISLAKHFTSGSILITDLAPGMVQQAKKMSADAEVKNVRYGPLRVSRHTCI